MQINLSKKSTEMKPIRFFTALLLLHSSSAVSIDAHNRYTFDDTKDGKLVNSIEDQLDKAKKNFD